MQIGFLYEVLYTYFLISGIELSVAMFTPSKLLDTRYWKKCCNYNFDIVSRNFKTYSLIASDLANYFHDGGVYPSTSLFLISHSSVHNFGTQIRELYRKFDYCCWVFSATPLLLTCNNFLMNNLVVTVFTENYYIICCVNHRCQTLYE